ncbi:MAG: hypothetical protein H6816_08135 [Phycisphaerales bacterium]|nr:hypothetical protein [Phycisphaerales bacterium]
MAREQRGGPAQGLSAGQQELVTRNLGLVHWHIRERVRNVKQDGVRRDYEDLFQEGCWGLMRAALSFDPRGGVRFAAYALARIHHAVSLFLYRNGSLLSRPVPRRRLSARRNAGATDPTDPTAPTDAIGATAASVESAQLGEARHFDEVGRNVPARVSCDGRSRWLRDRRGTRIRRLFVGDLAAAPEVAEAHGPTVAGRLGEKLAWAFARAAVRVQMRPAVRRDRRALIELLLAERLAIPEETERWAMRRVARQTASSCRRVMTCEQILLREVRRVLTQDLEFVYLVVLLRRSPDGGRETMSRYARRKLRLLAAETICVQLRRVPRAMRLRWFRRLLGGEAPDYFRVGQVLSRLRWDELDELLASLMDEHARCRRRDRSKKKGAGGADQGLSSSQRTSAAGYDDAPAISPARGSREPMPPSIELPMESTRVETSDAACLHPAMDAAPVDQSEDTAASARRSSDRCRGPRRGPRRGGRPGCSEDRRAGSRGRPDATRRRRAERDPHRGRVRRPNRSDRDEPNRSEHGGQSRFDHGAQNRPDRGARPHGPHDPCDDRRCAGRCSRRSAAGQ